MTRTNLPMLGLTLALGCGPGGSSADDGESNGSSESTGASEPDGEAIVDGAKGYLTTYVKINAESRPSQHGLASTVNMWTSPEVADLYRMFDPEGVQTAIAVPAETVVLKEHLDDAGAPVGFTLMFKGGAGYAPEAGDWWWGRVDSDGALQDQGQVGFCIACHSAVASEGWLFGVPLDNRAP